mmetsp:Transcript_106109/g.300209  ORF Transcript_106109/g.300209 Transcript_106109/m.300209 type:complete len:257 (-) Transcript_106109:343-1113(-)
MISVMSTAVAPHCGATRLRQSSSYARVDRFTHAGGTSSFSKLYVAFLRSSRTSRSVPSPTAPAPPPRSARRRRSPRSMSGAQHWSPSPPPWGGGFVLRSRGGGRCLSAPGGGGRNSSTSSARGSTALAAGCCLLRFGLGLLLGLRELLVMLRCSCRECTLESEGDGAWQSGEASLVRSSPPLPICATAAFMPSFSSRTRSRIQSSIRRNTSSSCSSMAVSRAVVHVSTARRRLASPSCSAWIARSSSAVPALPCRA